MLPDRIPPHDEAAEEAVLGSVLVEGEAITRIVPVLKPEDFYRERNRWTYEACLALFQRGEAIDQVSVGHELAARGRLDPAGGPAFLSHLIASLPTSVYADHYANIVARTATQRGLIRAASEIASMGYAQDADVDETLRQAEDILFRIRSRRETREFVPLREVLDQYLESSAAAHTPSDLTKGPVQTGFLDLDRLMGGLQRSDLFILAARPSLGKSTLALNITRNAAEHGAICGVFSLEMSREQLALRMLSAEAEVDSYRLRLNLLTERESQRVIDSVGALSDLPIYIDDTPLQTIVEIRSKARRLALERGLDLLVVDYIQLIQGNGRTPNRVQEMTEISRNLKGLARDLHVPLLALSQLSRAIEQRPSHRPQLSDLRDSGSIEQDADVVAFIHRDDAHFTEEEWERANPTQPYPKNVAEIVISKHRNGPLGSLNLFFRDQFSRFESFATRTPA
ncbi:MAG: replicative DNA helicase [Chloroflexi bacterium]|nr:replicative DNA helicase [Chloroflexota bacterium]MBI4197589.1 replicative DNA helicase [Chloroflexota bacterium]